MMIMPTTDILVCQYADIFDPHVDQVHANLPSDTRPISNVGTGHLYNINNNSRSRSKINHCVCVWGGGGGGVVSVDVGGCVCVRVHVCVCGVWCVVFVVG